MDNEKKIKILEKENMRLQAEIDRLNEQITDSRTLQDRYDELDSLKEKWEKEIEDIGILREKYSTLIGQLHSFKEIQDKIENK
ncbi:MAG: hypothetical protein ACLRYF_05050 [Mediterraneibacter faecis]|jgi:hypothetical protein